MEPQKSTVADLQKHLSSSRGALESTGAARTVGGVKITATQQRIVQGIAAKINHGRQQAAEGARLEKEGNEEVETFLKQCAELLKIDFEKFDFIQDQFVPKKEEAKT